MLSSKGQTHTHAENLRMSVRDIVREIKERRP
jgi:hypothetical protein